MKGVIEGIENEKIIRGIITVPGDKSITHRTIILGSITEGETSVQNFLDGLDCKNTMICRQAWGVLMVMEKTKSNLNI